MNIMQSKNRADFIKSSEGFVLIRRRKKLKACFSYTRLILFVIILSAVQNIKAQSTRGKLAIYGVAFLRSMYNNVNYNDAKAAINVYLGELSKKLISGYKMKPFIFDNVDDMFKNSIKDNLADMNLNPIDFIKYKSKYPMYPVYVSAGKNGPLENYLLVVNKNANIKSTKDLKHKTIGMLYEKNNPIPGMWLDVVLNQNHLIRKEKLFKKIDIEKNESNLILSLFFRKLDACIVTTTSYETMIELNPQIQKHTKILISSPGFLTTISCFTRKFKKSKYSANLLNTLLTIGNYTACKQLFALTKTEKIVPFREEYLSNIKCLYNEYSGLKIKK